MVDLRGIEPRPNVCHTLVLPLSLQALGDDWWRLANNHLSGSLSAYSIAYPLRPGVPSWCPRQESNPRPTV